MIVAKAQAISKEDKEKMMETFIDLCIYIHAISPGAKKSPRARKYTHPQVSFPPDTIDLNCTRSRVTESITRCYFPTFDQWVEDNADILLDGINNLLKYPATPQQQHLFYTG